MQTVALIIVLAAGLWLIAVAVLMALRPRLCLHLVERMKAALDASSWRLQWTEQGLRVLAGAALVVRAPASKLPLAFEVFGWILVISSLVILMLPIRMHGAYGGWVARWLTPPVLRLLSPVAAAAGAGLVWAAI